MSLAGLKDFERPGAAYRGKPFWAWNGKLEPEELRRQIRLMKRMGLGGFFMHSRVGLDTPYLSPEWFDCIDACVDEAATQGMEAWLYDEDRWPSGAAGGIVTRDPRYRMRSLVPETVADPAALEWTADTLAAFTARIEGDAAYEVKRVPRGRRPDRLEPGHILLAFVVRLQPCSDWYNGYTYLDTLSHEAVRKFIAVTHEAYRRHNGAAFGKTIPGMFTDEPNHGNKLHVDNNTGKPGGLPWTGTLPRTFRKRYGYALEPHLVELVYDVGGNGMTPARYHYHDCVTHLYVDAFCRQVGEWCARHKLLFTGHQLEEDTLSRQTNMVGSCMRTYEHMQAPGMDLLTEHWRVFNTAKQVSSAARQFGAKWRLTETYGCTGWDFPFLGHKALGDWQVALGINLRCQHLAWYTMEGEAKRDYPAAVFYQSPWWELYAKVEDYFARIHAVMTRGTEVRDLLVIHPVESAWMRVKTGWLSHPDTLAADDAFDRFTRTLLAAHLDFDFGDEELLSRHARVSRRGARRDTRGGPELRVGKAVYTAVLVPSMTTMRASTLALLKRFRAAGGCVVFAGEPAGHIEAVPSTAATELAATCPCVPTEGVGLVDALEETCRRVSIADGATGRELGPALYLLREDAEAAYLFVCNTGEDFVAAEGNQMQQPLARERTLAFDDVRIRGVRGFAGHPLELNPESGDVFAAAAERCGDAWELRTSLPALGSRLFVIPRKAQASVPAACPPVTAKHVTRLSGRRWDVTLSEDSCLVLDRPRYRVGGRTWQPADEILRVDRAVREALGIPVRGGGMKQPWMREKPERPKRVSLDLAYAFACDALPSGSVYVAVEQPARFRMWLNGVPIAVDAECGWWVDRSLRKVPVDSALLRLGANELALTCEYDETHPGLEIVYLLGAFGTRVEGTSVAVSALPTKLTLGDWVPQGLAFYGGSVTYRRTVAVDAAVGERIFVRVPDYRGVAFRVFVDGHVAGVSGWSPHEVEITDVVRGDSVELRIEIVGHRRNSHGPHHLNEKWPPWTGPAEYVAGPERWFDGFQLVPCGLMAAPEIIVRGA